jgi:uncharacterized protein (DUF362 family)/Pyruvate/2-oxoacid:ferredoxin oxidoreductase delta subunit
MKTHVAIAPCRTYQQEELSQAIDSVIGNLGGLERFIKPGERVLIKPNLLSARTPEEAVDTHPEFIRAVVRKVKSLSSTVIIGDSPGGFGKNTEEVYEVSGVRKVAEEEGVKLVKFDTSRKVGRYPVASCVLDADRVISLPKLKTHDVMLLTAAVKNMYGILPGIFKAEQHGLAPFAKDFASIIVDAYALRKPDLTLVDAVMSMDGDGPSRGRVRTTGFIIGSSDAVAIDSVLMKMVAKDPADLYTNSEAQRRGLGESRLENIEILGEAKDIAIDDFRFSRIRFLNTGPRFLLRLTKFLINFKIVIDNRRCTRCKLCQESCPADAIAMVDHSYKIDHTTCLLCLCCRELCPYGAVRVKRSWFARRIWG